jgi:nucleoside-diphosphate-sugar epimerase
MILVTGGAGFIGSHLVERLVAQGRAVRCLVRRSSSLHNLPRAGIDLAYGDLASGDGLPEAVRGVDTVIHLAGTTKATTVSGYYTGNAQATANLLRAAGAVGRFVHVSSMAAAGPSALGSSAGRRRRAGLAAPRFALRPVEAGGRASRAEIGALGKDRDGAPAGGLRAGG